MHLKGAEKFCEKLPGYAGQRIFILLILGHLSFLIGLLFMLFLECRQRVPALIVKPRMLGSFFRFLIGHQKSQKS